MTQSTITIGYPREDGDIAVLATLSNNDEHGHEAVLQCYDEAIEAEALRGAP